MSDGDVGAGGRRPRVRGGLVVLVALCGLVATATFHVVVERALRAARDAVFERETHEDRMALEAALASSLDVLQAAAGLYLASEEVTFKEFQRFVTPWLSNHPEVVSVEWLAHAEPASRRHLEEGLRAQGLEGFVISDLAPSRVLVPAPDRAEMFPVAYAVPLEPNRGLLGFDTATDPASAAAMARARKTGEAITTPVVALRRPPGLDEHLGFLVHRPVFRGGPRDHDLLGFVRASLDVARVVAAPTNEVLRLGVDVRIDDVTEPGAPALVSQKRSPLWPPGTHPPAAMAAAGPLQRRTEEIAFAGRRFLLSYEATPYYGGDVIAYVPWVGLAAGLVSTMLAAALVASLVNRSRRIQRFAAALAVEDVRRRGLEAELRASQQRFQSFLDEAPLAAAIVGGDGGLLFANRPWTTRFAGAEPPPGAALPTELLERRTGPDGEARDWLVLRFRLAEREGGAIGTFAVDMTQRVEDRRRLAISEERFRLLVDGVQDYAVVMLDREGCVESWNVGAERIFGYGAAEILGRHLSALAPAESEAAVAQELAAALRDRRVEQEGWRVRKDGSRFWAGVVLTTVHDQAGAVRGFAKVTRDLTERRRAEEEIRALTADLERRVVERTAALEAANHELEAFSYSVSHDLRAPLRHVHGYIDMLRRRSATALDETSRRYLDVIAEAALRMGHLIDDLLAFSRTSRVPMHLAPIDMAAVVAAARAAVEPEAAQRTVVWEVAPLPAVRGDAALLRQVWINLLSNALKYTRPRPEAHVTVGCAPGEDGTWTFSVHDDGVGFDMQYVHKLFGVFQRLHRAEDFEGTGIGLATVQRIVHRHGGRTWAEGIPDVGATVYFTLPRDAQA